MPSARSREKPPVVTDTSPPPPPKPEEKPVEKKPDPPKPVAENKPKEEPKPIEKKPDPPKVDPIAEALKKDESKKPPPKPEAKAAAAAAAEAEAEREFDQSKIAALLDKRDPTRQADHRRHAEFERRARHCQGQGRRQFRDLEARCSRRRSSAAGRSPMAASRARHLEVAFDIKLKRDGTLEATAGSGRHAGDALSARLSGERAARDHRMPALQSAGGLFRRMEIFRAGVHRAKDLSAVMRPRSET